MSGSQKGVLWLGFLLILVRMLTGGDWSSIWGTLKGNGGNTAAPAPAAPGTPAARTPASQPQTAPNPVQARL